MEKTLKYFPSETEERITNTWNKLSDSVTLGGHSILCFVKRMSETIGSCPDVSVIILQTQGTVKDIILNANSHFYDLISYFCEGNCFVCWLGTSNMASAERGLGSPGCS